MVGHAALNRAIGVRIPASQPYICFVASPCRARDVGTPELSKYTKQMEHRDRITSFRRNALSK